MFDRGFKSWCEKYALDVRKGLKLKAHDKLDPIDLARQLKIGIWNVDDVPGLSQESISILTTEPGASIWSAITLVHGPKRRIVLNSTHSTGRQSSNLMHELAHTILEHVPDTIEISLEGIAVRKNYDKKQEQEADWLAACLLLPRPVLVRIRKSAMDANDAIAFYGVSRSMLNYRMAVSGVQRQYS